MLHGAAPGRDTALLQRRRIAGANAIDAVRAIRSAIHGFISLEAGGGFRLQEDLDTSDHRLIDAPARG